METQGKIETIEINGRKYIAADSVRQAPETTGDIRIVILQRGFIAVGRFTQDGTKCRLTDAAHIRRWGTTAGLGELAAKGPLPNTKLDKCPPIEFHELTVIHTMECAEEAWNGKLG